MTAVAQKSNFPEPLSTAEILALREEFPILKNQVKGKPLIYLDSAATSLKPRSVVNAISDHYLYKTSNVHRGIHTLSEEATTAFEAAREAVRSFLNARDSSEIIFTRGTTDSLNLIALSYARKFLEKNDEILITEMEHHSNIVPWQMACEATGAILKIVPIHEDGSLNMDAYAKMLNAKTRLVAITHVSNTLGTINPIRDITRLAHNYNAIVVVDGAQAVAHFQADVQELDCDFYAFSAHKIFGPTGLGVLYGKSEILSSMPPVQGGGAMIEKVTFEKTTYNVIPYKFEAGTPHIAGVVGLHAALDFINHIGFERLHVTGQKLLAYAQKKFSQIPGYRLIGTAPDKIAVMSFVHEKAHAHDIGTLLDMNGIAIRTGHHCTQPLLVRFGVSATARASFGVYNTQEDIDVFIDALQKINQIV